jgi:hypothetical protein
MSATYQQTASRSTPGCVIFLLDHSFSMTEGLAGSPRSKRDALATTINRFLTELLLRCEKDEGVRHYFDVAVIGYTTDQQGTPIIGPALKGALSGRELVSTVELSDYPLRVDEKDRMVDDGAGGLVSVKAKIAIWYEAPADTDMAGTPMCAALNYVSGLARQWCDSHSSSFPPIVIHITDGESNDGDPEPAAIELRKLQTQDGELLLFNCHLSKLQGIGVLFPVSEAELPADPSAHLLFRMSSPVPEILRNAAEVRRIQCTAGARGMAFNADGTQMVSLIQVGTLPSGFNEQETQGFETPGETSESPLLV